MDHEHEHDDPTDEEQVPGMPPEDMGHFSEAKRNDGAGAAEGGPAGADDDADDDAKKATEESTLDRR